MRRISSQGRAPEVAKMDSRQLTFRKLLFRLGEKLTQQDLDHLIFICRGTLRASRVDKLRSATDLFQALGERGKLSADNLGYLAQILTSIGKANLLDDWRTEGFTVSTPSQLDREYAFQECLLKVAQDLTSVNVENMTFVLGPNLGSLNSERIFSATQLFQILQQRQLVTASELQLLYDALIEIGRKDTTLFINQYMQCYHLGNNASEVAPKPYANPPQMNAPYFEPQHSISSGETDTPNRFPVRESSQSITPSPAPNTDSQHMLPFGLRFDVFEDQESSREAKLLQSLSVKEGELRYKEDELLYLQRELSKQVECREKMVQQRAEDQEVFSQSIQDLQHALAVKNQEVTSLVEELRYLHQQMATLQAATSVSEEDLYKMDKQPHGVCLIFNNYKFYHPEDMEKANPPRGGAEIDQHNLTQTFKYLRYEVIVHENLTAQEMQDTIWNMATRDHKPYDSFVCCILTHGETNVVHGADSQEVDLLNFAATMKLCPTLREKPKMFFVQACRGEGEHKGLDVQKDSGPVTATIPQEADFFFGYATPTGNAAYRSKRHGSWYISELCKVFAKHGYTHNLSSMMKKVNHQVSKAYTKEGFKQCPEFVDRLRKEVHFFHFLR